MYQRLVPLRLVWPSILAWALLQLGSSGSIVFGQQVDLQVASFEVDVTPPVGSPLAYDPMIESTGPLTCKGLVLLPANQRPIVLCSIDWLGVANAAQDGFKQAIADKTDTIPTRVVIHSLHQHDAPRCDLSAADVLREVGLADQHFDVSYIEQSIRRAADAAGESLKNAKPVTGVASGHATVEKVASNRRMLGPDGKVHTTRYTACKDAAIRALPEGVVDPKLRSLLFMGEEGPLALVSFYATHPQSYYRTGQANPDFPGMARDSRQKATGVFHLHFNGAGGNIGAGKYNDGAHANRKILASRVAAAMDQAWNAANDAIPQDPAGIVWTTEEVLLPPGKHLHEADLLNVIRDTTAQAALQLNAAKKLAYLRRANEGVRIAVARLHIADKQLLFLPGELFVEYQLAAQQMRPDHDVMVAAYGEYGTGYIGTRAAYPQGGYEVSERASNVGPDAEAALLASMKRLLDASDTSVTASDFTEREGPLPIRD